MFFIPFELPCGLCHFFQPSLCRNRFLSVPSHLTPEQASSPGPCTLQEWIHRSVPRSTRVCCHLALCSLAGFWKTEILLKCWFLTNVQMYTNASKSGIALPGPSPRHTCSVPSPDTGLNKAWVTHAHCAQFHEQGNAKSFEEHFCWFVTLMMLMMMMMLSDCLCTQLQQLASLTSFRIDGGCCGRCRRRSLLSVATRISYAYRQIYICMKCPAHN